MIFGQIATVPSATALLRAGQAAAKLCAARKAGKSDIDAMSEIMFQFSPPLTATEQKTAITTANKTCPVVVGIVKPVAPTPTVPAPVIAPLAPLPTPPAGMSTGAKVAIGVGIGVASVTVLYLLLR
jgi:hypothetical protein